MSFLLMIFSEFGLEKSFIDPNPQYLKSLEFYKEKSNGRIFLFMLRKVFHVNEVPLKISDGLCAGGLA